MLRDENKLRRLFKPFWVFAALNGGLMRSFCCCLGFFQIPRWRLLCYLYGIYLCAFPISSGCWNFNFQHIILTFQPSLVGIFWQFLNHLFALFHTIWVGGHSKVSSKLINLLLFILLKKYLFLYPSTKRYIILVYFLKGPTKRRLSYLLKKKKKIHSQQIVVKLISHQLENI